jgi:hypothetical protein
VEHTTVWQSIQRSVDGPQSSYRPYSTAGSLKHRHSRDKAAIVLAIRQGVIIRNEAKARYMLSEEELSGWEEAFDRDGLAGLQAKRQRGR